MTAWPCQGKGWSLIRCHNCKQHFTPNTHNQIYDSAECRREATNRKIMEKYYENKTIKQNRNKECQECGTKLNMYNDSGYCLVCYKRRNVDHKKVLKEIKHGLRGFEE